MGRVIDEEGHSRDKMCRTGSLDIVVLGGLASPSTLCFYVPT